MPFDHYQKQIEQRIRRLRRDLEHSSNADWIVTANSPFEMHPKEPQPTKGILLIHGLLDSPFTMRDLGKFYQQQGFLVRGILLDGHGTIPEQLDKVEAPQWIENVDYAVGSLQKIVDDVYICGFSTGGLLALHHALINSRIKGVIALCPAIKLNSGIFFGTQLLNWTKRLTERDYWNVDREETDPVKYNQFPMHAAYQVTELERKFELLYKKLTLTTPLFFAITEDDETVSAEASLTFFKHTENTKNRLLYFSNNVLKTKDSRIIVERAEDQEHAILDYSHIAIPIAPDNEHYGAQGDYKLPIFYRNKEDKTIYRGALNKKNLKQHNLQRLTYNPQFALMCDYIKTFLASIG